MSTLFVFDTVLLKDKSNNFYGMTLTYEFFKNRYLPFCDKVSVVTRSKNINEENGNIEGYRITNGKNVSVSPIKNYNDIPDMIRKKKKISNEIDELVKNSDNLIIRMPSVLGMFACESAKKYNKKYIIELVVCPWDGYMNHVRFGGKVLAPIMSALTRKYIKNAQNVLYVTSEFLQRRYPTNGNKIACSDVVLKSFNEDILNLRLRKIEKIEEDNTIKLGTIASVGAKYKGQEYVIQAMKKLKEQGKKVEYYLAGGGNPERLKRIAINFGVENEVHFLGSLPHEEVFNLVDTIDLYIQPSLAEGLPRALIEAMSRGCPAIGSNAGGIPELLDKDLVFNKKNVNEVVDILKGINKEKLKKQAKINFYKAKEFDKSKLDEKRKEFYVKCFE